ncbi:MAG: hypothetical protein HN341_08455 [Verrucomicrobia bacterium]|jgi:hypothetical protein|nr:hypothetical protein [Verrucomicrobiota bacterium]
MMQRIFRMVVWKACCLVLICTLMGLTGCSDSDGAGEPEITFAKYAAIKAGMTYDQVRDLMGRDADSGNGSSSSAIWSSTGVVINFGSAAEWIQIGMGDQVGAPINSVVFKSCAIRNEAGALETSAEPLTIAPPVTISLYGIWHGTAASGTVPTTLELISAGKDPASQLPRLTGSVTWPGGDVRAIEQGLDYGTYINFRIQGNDIWTMSLSGSALSGTAQKSGGGTYSLSFAK